MPAEEPTRPDPEAYVVEPDAVRDIFEREFYGGVLERLLAGEEATTRRVLDLGCGDGLVARLAGLGAGEYVGVDLAPRPGPGPADRACYVAHDLADGLGAVGAEPYDLYVSTFGVISHLEPAALERLLSEIAAHAEPGAVVALEALGLHSLEWPRLWSTRPGRRRRIAYELGADVAVHPWSRTELAARFTAAGIEPVVAIDRTVQAGPKTDGSPYWPGLPPLRGALNALLAGDHDAAAVLEAPLPPLPAHPAAAEHHALARRRAGVARRSDLAPHELARSTWRLEPIRGLGLGHGLLLVGRVR